jgi:hypothetical protein
VTYNDLSHLFVRLHRAWATFAAHFEFLLFLLFFSFVESQVPFKYIDFILPGGVPSFLFLFAFRRPKRSEGHFEPVPHAHPTPKVWQLQSSNEF